MAVGDGAAVVRVGIVGPGWWTETMFVPALAGSDGAVLRAICGRSAERTSTFARTHGIPLVFTDPMEMFASGEIDAVIISTVNKTHHRLTMAAFDAGLHVLCEKPLAMTVAEADQMAAAAGAGDRVCMVPFTYRFMPTSRWVKRLIDDGYLGRPYLLNLRYYAGYARDGEYAWRFDVGEAGAGVLGDLGSHWIDMARWFFGDIDAVTCVLSHHVERAPRPDGGPYDVADDGATIIAEFANGAQGTLTVSAATYADSPFGQLHQFDLFGSDGSLYMINDWDTVQDVHGAKPGQPMRALPIPDDIWGDVRRAPVGATYRDVFRRTDALTRGWIHGIRSGQPVEPGFDTGAAVQRVIAACALSSVERRRVRVDEVGP
ncbi:MAG: Gfo/Idh/MocA family protein [Desertimonas sp.]